MPDNPTRRAGVGRLGRSAGTGVTGAAAVTLAVWAVEQWAAITVSPEAATAATTLVAALMAALTPDQRLERDTDV